VSQMTYNRGDKVKFLNYEHPWKVVHQDGNMVWITPSNKASVFLGRICHVNDIKTFPEPEPQVGETWANPVGSGAVKVLGSILTEEHLYIGYKVEFNGSICLSPVDEFRKHFHKKDS
jgi:hypothetical protein